MELERTVNHQMISIIYVLAAPHSFIDKSRFKLHKACLVTTLHAVPYAYVLCPVKRNTTSGVQHV